MLADELEVGDNLVAAVGVEDEYKDRLPHFLPLRFWSSRESRGEHTCNAR